MGTNNTLTSNIFYTVRNIAEIEFQLQFEKGRSTNSELSRLRYYCGQTKGHLVDI